MIIVEVFLLNNTLGLRGPCMITPECNEGVCAARFSPRVLSVIIGNSPFWSLFCEQTVMYYTCKQSFSNWIEISFDKILKPRGCQTWYFKCTGTSFFFEMDVDHCEKFLDKFTGLTFNCGPWSLMWLERFRESKQVFRPFYCVASESEIGNQLSHFFSKR